MIDDGNGKKIAVHEVQIEQLISLAKDTNDMLQRMFGPDGVCPAERAKNASLAAQVKIIWGFVGVAVASLIGIVADLIAKRG